MKRELKITLTKDEVKEAVKDHVQRQLGDKVLDVVVETTKLGELVFEVQCETAAPKGSRKSKK